MYSLIIHFGVKKYELSLTIDIGLLHMYHLSVLPPKQHTIPLIFPRQISIPNVSPNLTDARVDILLIFPGITYRVRLGGVKRFPALKKK